MITNLEISIKSIPWMWGKLLETKSNTLLFFLEVKDNNLNLLVEIEKKRNELKKANFKIK